MRGHGRGLPLLVLAVVVLSASCSEDGQDASSDAGIDAESSGPVVDDHQHGPDDGHDHDHGEAGDSLSQSQPAIDPQVAEDAAEAQRGYLADGVITAEERQEAFSAWIECLESNGFVIATEQLNPDGEKVAYTHASLDDLTARRVGEECRISNYRVLQHVYQAQNATNPEAEAEWLAEITGCMRERGIETTDEPSVIDLLDIAPGELGDCLDAYFQRQAIAEKRAMQEEAQ